MTTKERISLFINELTLIKSSTIRQIVAEQLAEAPEYFFHVPASASGKYHPAYALGEGGLVRHTKAAVQIAKDLFKAGLAEWYTVYDSDSFLPTEEFQDAAYAALILHDTYKLGMGDSALDKDGNPRHTQHDHPNIAFERFMAHLHHPECMPLTQEESLVCSQIACAIATHMGQWIYSPHSSTVLMTPSSWLERFVHLCDYLASRKNIEVKLEGATNE